MKTFKRILSIMMALVLVLAMGTQVFALNTIKPDPTQITNGNAGNVASNALGVIQFFGYAMAIGMIIYIGIKYMMASANEKADLKKGAINYVIGAILVAAATTVVGIFWSFGSNISN